MIRALLLSMAVAVAAQTPSPPPGPPHETFFYAHDGLRLQAHFYRPAGEGPYPLVVYNHGSALPGQERVEWSRKRATSSPPPTT